MLMLQLQGSQLGVEELNWPAQCPDLHPIQHLWNELEQPGSSGQPHLCPRGLKAVVEELYTT